MQRPTHHLAALLAATGLAAGTGSAALAAPEVIASIKPVHSLVAGVMEGVGEPALILEGASSPHAYSLRPSTARTLQEADLIVWIGPDMEAFLEGPVATIGADARVVTLADTDGLNRLALREGGAFEAHSHGDHGHGADGHAAHEHAAEGHDDAEAHEDHAHDGDAHDGDAHDDHAHDDHAHDGHAHEAGADDETARAGPDQDHGHDHGHVDAHYWLDPQNAALFAAEIAEALAEIDPDNAATYAANAERIDAELHALTEEIAATLEPVRDGRFVVFHDAYRHFEERFGLAATGAITVSPEVMPGADRVAEIRERLSELGASCVFSEPQFEPRIVSVVTEGTPARTGELDPLGAALEPGPDLYPELLRTMAESIRECLGEAG